MTVNGYKVPFWGDGKVLGCLKTVKFMMRELDLNKAIRKKTDKNKSIRWWDDLACGPSLQTQLSTVSSESRVLVSCHYLAHTGCQRHIQTHGPQS